MGTGSIDILTIVLAVLAVAGIWAVVELALTFRRLRGTADAVDKTLSDINANVGQVVDEARPVIAKLDGALDDLAPAVAEVEPLIKKGNVALDALSADLIEVNGVLRDVSSVTGTVSGVTDAVSGVGEAASGAVSRLLGRRGAAAPQERTLEGGSPEPDAADEPASHAAQDACDEPAAAGKSYYVYADSSEPVASDEPVE